eukprot:8144966-Alexandrium_andersonii.AAC.1
MGAGIPRGHRSPGGSGFPRSRGQGLAAGSAGRPQPLWGVSLVWLWRGVLGTPPRLAPSGLGCLQ